MPLTRSGALIGTVTKAMTDGVYKQAKAQGLKFEIIFISGDEDQESYDSYRMTMLELSRCPISLNAIPRGSKVGCTNSIFQISESKLKLNTYNQ